MSKSKDGMKKIKHGLFLLGCLAVYGLLIYLLVFFVSKSGVYPAGENAMLHLYKGDFLLEQIQKKHWLPRWDANWYNGTDTRGYWAPLSAYVLAFCQWVGGKNIWNGYLFFIAGNFLCGAICWLSEGLRRGRKWMGAVLGALWFFMPANLYTLFQEGNLPQSICSVILPFFLFSLYGYLYENRWSCLPKAVICLWMLFGFHLGYALFVMVAVFLFLALYVIPGEKKKRAGVLFVTLLLGGLAAGGSLFVYGNTTGISFDVKEIIEMCYQNPMITIHPLLRQQEGYLHYYVGLAIFILLLFGMLFSQKGMTVWFWTGFLLLFVTASFLSLPLAFACFGIMQWKSLRKPFVGILLLCMVVDVVPSLKLIHGGLKYTVPEDRYETIEENTLIGEAKKITKQRMALLDASTLGAEGAYLVSAGEDGVKATYGSGWEAAVTAENIVQLNQAMQDGNYLYLFDRCVELGNDTVLLCLDQTNGRGEDVEELDIAAKKSGYEVRGENLHYRLYHRDTPACFGLISKYETLGIGTSAPMMAQSFPGIEEREETNLNSYTYEELSQYKEIYLAGFTYTNRKKAETMIKKLSENGVRIVILADGIPEDGNTGLQTFLGVTCQKITFSNGYPELETEEGVLHCDLFPQGYTKWNTVYMKGLQNVQATTQVLDEELAIYGTGENENLVYIGLNLTYHYALTKDVGVGRLLMEAFEMEENALPKREVVPLEIFSQGNTICIKSPKNDVNTTLAYQKAFCGEKDFYEKNHLTYVNKGETVLKVGSPYFVMGLVITAIGGSGTIGILVWTRRKSKKEMQSDG